MPNIGSYRVDFDATIATALAVPVGFAVLAGTTVTNSANTVITGDVGDITHTGFPPGTITGVFHDNDAAYVLGQTILTGSIAIITSFPPGPDPGDLSGQTLGPGVYDSPAGMTLNSGTLTLNGAGLYIFRSVSSTNGVIALTNGATANHVFWYAATDATFGPTTSWQGTVIAGDSITAAAGDVFNGPMFTKTGTIILNDNTGINTLSDHVTTSFGGQLSVNFSAGLSPNTFIPLNATTLVGIVNQGQLHGNPVISTTFVNTRIQIINPSTVNTLLLTPSAGGALPVTARLLITQES